MSVKPTIIILVLAAIGLAAMWYVGWKEPEGTATARTVQTMFDSRQLPIDAVVRIRLTRAREAAMVFERRGSGWMQVDPFPYPMDAFSIRQIAVLAGELEVAEVLTPGQRDKPSSLEALGLAPPAAEVTYEWMNGSLTVQLGRQSVAGRAYLRVVGDDRAYLVNHDLHERAVRMNPAEWRDRTVFHGVGIESDLIESVQGDRRMVLMREHKQWSMVEPVRARVDDEGFAAFLHDLARARVAGFVLDQPDDLSRFGLSAPVASLTVTTQQPGDGQHETRQTLLIGSRVGSSTEDRYGVVEGRPVVLRIPGAALAAFFRAPHQLVDSTASGVIPADVKSIVIRTADAELTLERDLDVWHAPNHGGQRINTDFVGELLEQLTHLRAPLVQIADYPHELHVADVSLYGYDKRALDTVRIAREADGGSWILENGDRVLRIFPPGMSMRLTPKEFGM